MAPDELARREFLLRSVAGAGALGAIAAGATPAHGELVNAAVGGGTLPEYRGPNVVLIRFGGGVRRLETVNADGDRKSTRLNSSHIQKSRMPSSA